MYQISDYSLKQALKLGVTIKPSANKNKKIDVFKDSKKVASIGSINYNDYPTYLKNNGLKYAKERRKLYKTRHERDRHQIGSNGYYADKILW
jgi:hypothetical protein